MIAACTYLPVSYSNDPVLGVVTDAGLSYHGPLHNCRSHRVTMSLTALPGDVLAESTGIVTLKHPQTQATRHSHN